MGKLKPSELTDEEFLYAHGGKLGPPPPAQSGAQISTPAASPPTAAAPGSPLSPGNPFDGWTPDQLCTFLSQPGGKYPCAPGSYHFAQPPQAHVRTEKPAAAPGAAESLSDQALKSDLAKYPNLAAWCSAHHITHLLDDNGQPAVACVKADHMTDAELSAAIHVSRPTQPEAPRMKVYNTPQDAQLAISIDPHAPTAAVQQPVPDTPHASESHLDGLVVLFWLLAALVMAILALRLLGGLIAWCVSPIVGMYFRHKASHTDHSGR